MIARRLETAMIELDKRDILPPWQAVETVMRHVRTNSLLRNSIYIMGTTILTSLLGYLYWIIAARSYSTHDIGLASALIAAISLTSNLSNLGLGSTLVQTLPRSTSGRAWSLTFNAAI